MELYTTNRKISIVTSAKIIDVDKVDYLIVDFPTQTISLWRGREFKITYTELTAYNGGALPSFCSLVADVRHLTGEDTSYDVISTALEASHIIQASPGYLSALNVYNDAATGQYIQLFDSATLPADGTVPVKIMYLATKATGSMPLGDGMAFTKGIVVCNSSTGGSKTIGSANCWFDGSYV